MGAQLSPGLYTRSFGSSRTSIAYDSDRSAAELGAEMAATGAVGVQLGTAKVMDLRAKPEACIVWADGSRSFTVATACSSIPTNQHDSVV